MEGSDPSKESTHIMYLDANGLYGSVMQEELPVSGFKWLGEKDLETLDQFARLGYKPPSGLGYTLEVDLKYPEELQDLHNDYPLAPEKVKINGVKKLTPNLFDKKRYVLMYEALQFYMSQGLVLAKIHRGILYNTLAFMRDFVQFNMRKRQQAKSEFEKGYYKLANNAPYGNSFENVRNRCNVELVCKQNEQKLKRLVAKPGFQSAPVLESSSMVQVRTGKSRVVSNKPIFVGSVILDKSKLVMYNFHYEYMLKKYSYQDCKLLLTDTDSLVYQIKTEDFYKDISKDVYEKFDTSNYPKDHPSKIPTGVNKKVLGMFKDELGGVPISELVALDQNVKH